MSKTQTMNIIQAVNDALRLQMRKDPRVLVMGEDVGKFGGVFRATQGLYQEFGGEQAVYDPAANIQVGAKILKEYLRITGNLGSALQMYAGALGDSEDQYSNKVMNEKNRLQQVVAQSRPAPVRTASASTHTQTPTRAD